MKRRVRSSFVNTDVRDSTTTPLAIEDSPEWGALIPTVGPRTEADTVLCVMSILAAVACYFGHGDWAVASAIFSCAMYLMEIKEVLRRR